MFVYVKADVIAIVVESLRRRRRSGWQRGVVFREGFVENYSETPRRDWTYAT